jgi:hypothetical protein
MFLGLIKFFIFYIKLTLQELHFGSLFGIVGINQLELLSKWTTYIYKLELYSGSI